MRNRGVANPRRGAVISVVVALVSGLAVWWGVSDMLAHEGRETTYTAVAIAVGGLVGFFALIMLANSIWAMRIYSALQRGDGVIAKWVVAPATFELFRAAEDTLAKNGQDNDYPVPRRTPPEGLPIWFNQDGVLIGDRFFGLASTGVARFAGVHLRQGVPSTLEFSTVLTTAYAQPRMVIRHQQGQLRVPIDPRNPREAQKVLDHYSAVMARRVIVKPHFWTLRIRIGLVAALLGGLAFAVGFLLREQNSEMNDIPAIAAVVGAVVGIGGLVLAALAAMLRQHQRRG